MPRINFNPANFKPSDGVPDPLPADWYAMQIIESKEPKSQAGDTMLNLTFEVLEGVHPQYKGRKAWVNLNIGHSSPKPREIAERDLCAICHAIGMLSVINDTEDLHFKPMAVKLVIEPGSGGYGPKNKPVQYRPYAAQFAGGAPVSPTVSTPPPMSSPQQPPAPSAPTAPPWAKPS